MATRGEISRLLAGVGAGEREAFDDVLPLVYDQLRAVAHHQLARRRPGQTLDTTALVHEAYLKLAPAQRAAWTDREHFLAVAAVAMRHLLVDHARRRAARKRGGDNVRVTFDEARLGQVETHAAEILAIDQGLDALAELNPRLSRLVELRFFGGLTMSETAAALEISERTLRRDWRKARAFLLRFLDRLEPEDAS